MPLEAYANYVMDPLQLGFSFRVKPPTNFIYYMLLYVMVFFLLSGPHVAAVFTNGDSTIGICTAATLWNIPLAGTCASC